MHLRCMIEIRPTVELQWFSSASIICDWSVVSAMSTISSANRRSVNGSPLTMMPSSLSMFRVTIYGHEGKSFGETAFSCLISLRNRFVMADKSKAITRYNLRTIGRSVWFTFGLIPLEKIWIPCPPAMS